MKNVKIISEFLKKDLAQRSIYGIGLLIWAVIWIDDLKLYDSESSIGIKYWWIMIIPTLILVGQIIWNKKLLWLLAVILFGTYTIWTFWNMLFLEILLDYHRDFVPSSRWTEKIFGWSLIVMVLLAVNWTLWKIKPNKNNL